MDKDEILEKSRKENKFGNNDDYQQEIRLKSFRIATLVGIVLCIAFMFIERLNYSYLVICNAVNAAIYTYQAVKLKDKTKYTGVIWIVVTFLWLILYVLDRINVL